MFLDRLIPACCSVSSWAWLLLWRTHPGNLREHSPTPSSPLLSQSRLHHPPWSPGVHHCLLDTSPSLPRLLHRSCWRWCRSWGTAWDWRCTTKEDIGFNIEEYELSPGHWSLYWQRPPGGHLVDFLPDSEFPILRPQQWHCRSCWRSWLVDTQEQCAQWRWRVHRVWG